MTEAVLVLESGQSFVGQGFGALDESLGEAVFNTAMSGYQEILTDPSYAGQIITMTAPQIGNVGVNEQDSESEFPRCAGFVCKELSPLVSNWRSQGNLDEYLLRHGVFGLQGVDTRALTRALRDGGAQRAVLSTRVNDIDELVRRAQGAPSMVGQDLASRVTCSEMFQWDGGLWNKAPAPERDFHVVAYDFGAKMEIFRHLVDVGCRLTVVPSTTPAADVLAMNPNGVFLSNGPGDPAAVTYAIETTRTLIDAGIPMFGICLGHQIIGLAIGAKTEKLAFGHHGANHPVQELKTGKVEITSQNHGFVVVPDSLPDTAEATHLNLFDKTLAGLRLLDKPVFSVQYHPEASPGPKDSAPLFQRFVGLMREHA